MPDWHPILLAIQQSIRPNHAPYLKDAKTQSLSKMHDSIHLFVHTLEVSVPDDSSLNKKK